MRVYVRTRVGSDVNEHSNIYTVLLVPRVTAVATGYKLRVCVETCVWVCVM